MFRLGVVSKERIPTAIVPPGRAIALTLLEEFDIPMSQADEARLAGIYEMIVNGPRHMPMLTFPNRFRALDEAIAEAIEATFAPDRPVRVRDMAASNAITSLELFEYLTRRFGDRVSLRATDYVDALYVVAIPKSKWQVIFDAAGEPMQFIRGRLVLSASREPRRYVVNRLLQKILAPALLRKAAITRARSPAQRISLFHPRTVAAASAGRGFSLAREDALIPEGTPCDVLRVMNLSHRFSLDPSRPWFGPACRTLADGGLLVIGAGPMPDRPLEATIFQRRGQKFFPTRDFGGGYAHRQDVLDFDRG